ncbi:hypothetical protein FRC02_007394 [Tulasnella sp. 418]|nr:hypothetical protein FRC02_007394 [Tulasnella sp. 418]
MWLDQSSGSFGRLVVWLVGSSHLVFWPTLGARTALFKANSSGLTSSQLPTSIRPYYFLTSTSCLYLESLLSTHLINKSIQHSSMTFSSISSTYPEPASSPSPLTSSTPIKFVHAPLRRTYAFYIPRKISTRPTKPIRSINITSQARRPIARRSKLAKPARASTTQNEEAQNEPEETMAPPAKRRKIKD